MLALTRFLGCYDVHLSCYLCVMKKQNNKKESNCLSPLLLYHKSVLHAAAYQDHQEMLAGMIAVVVISQTDLEPEKFTSDAQHKMRCGN